jgi:hypothetical protein
MSTPSPTVPINAISNAWQIALPEFLDTFYFALRGYPCPKPQTCLDTAPPALDDPTQNATLAAVAEHLALRWHQHVPDWVHHPSRFLKLPVFPGDTQHYRGYYFIQSPVAFRRRMIFTEAEPLRRARFPRAEFLPRDSARGYTWHRGAMLGVFGTVEPPSDAPQLTRAELTRPELTRPELTR